MISSTAFLKFEANQIVLEVTVAPDSPSSTQMYDEFLKKFNVEGTDAQASATYIPGGHAKFSIKLKAKPPKELKEEEGLWVKLIGPRVEPPIPSIEPKPGTPGGVRPQPPIAVKPISPTKPPIVTRPAPPKLLVPTEPLPPLHKSAPIKPTPLTPTEMLKKKLEADKKK